MIPPKYSDRLQVLNSERKHYQIHFYYTLLSREDKRPIFYQVEDLHLYLLRDFNIDFDRPRIKRLNITQL